jgi:hypothetical protein
VLWDPFRVTLFCLMVISISRFPQYFRWLKPLRPAMTLLILTAAYAYFNPRFLVSGSILRSWPCKVTPGIAITACVSVPFGISMSGSAMFIIEESSPSSSWRPPVST